MFTCGQSAGNLNIMSESEIIKVLSPLEIEQRSTRIDIDSCVARMEDLKSRFENPGLTEKQLVDIRTAIHGLFEILKEAGM